jgi:hypothetical protein
VATTNEEPVPKIKKKMIDETIRSIRQKTFEFFFINKKNHPTKRRKNAENKNYLPPP